MDKILFKETENKVRRYYQKDKLINSLNNKINLLERQIEAIEQDLKNCNINLEPGIKAISWEERVQSSSDGSSYAEKEAMRITEYMIKRVADKKMEKQMTLEQIDQIEKDYLYVSAAIEPIQGQHKAILEYYYKKGLRENRIANLLNWDQSNVNRKRRELIIQIADWDMWNKVS